MPLLASPYWPFAVLALGIIFIILLIAGWKQHAFISLMLAAIFVGLLAHELPGDASVHHLIRAVELPMEEFGIIAGKIAFVIAMAAIIGIAMMDSGAADRIIRFLIEKMGEKRAGPALLITGFFLSIPVFFDTVFFLLIPLAQALTLRLGKNYLLYVMSICGGAAITHSLVAPTPGPLIMAETLELDLGITIVVGILAGLLPAISVAYFAKWINQRMNVPLREAAGVSKEDLEKAAVQSEEDLPPLLLSVLPVLLPVLLISMASFMGLVRETVPVWISFLGNKNLALLIGTILALGLLVRQKGIGIKSLQEVLGPPLQVAGIIILITSAGGAFGAMIKHAGVGDAIQFVTAGSGINYIILAWVIAAVMKIAQGSGTVAIITAAAIMAGIIGDGSDLSFHPIYIFLAIGFGSLFVSWMNDSGFWVVAKMSGFTEKETLWSWTLLLAMLSLVGLIEILIASALFPNFL